MRTRLILVIGFFLGLSVSKSVQAQKESANDKVTTALKKFDDTIKPDKSKRSSLESVFSDFYTAQEKLRNNIQGPASTLRQGLQQQDYQSVRKQNENLYTDRDDRLKKILSDDEFKKWKNAIEPSLRKK